MKPATLEVRVESDSCGTWEVRLMVGGACALRGAPWTGRESAEHEATALRAALGQSAAPPALSHPLRPPRGSWAKRTRLQGGV